MKIEHSFANEESYSQNSRNGYHNYDNFFDKSKLTAPLPIGWSV